MENKIIKLSKDEKSIVKREINSIFGSLKALYDWIEEDKLVEDMKENLPKLIDYNLNGVKKAIGYTGELTEREKSIEAAIIADQQQEIDSLKSAVKESNQLSSVCANTISIFEKIKKWWEIEGFEYLQDKKINAGGLVEINFGFMLNSMLSNYSETPETDKENLQTKVEYMKDKGFEFMKDSLDILDNDNNRHLLMDMMEEAFPSSKVVKFENHCRSRLGSRERIFIIRSFQVIIENIKDVENLDIKEKTFLFEL